MKRAFSLVEVLIAVAILGILAAVVVPTFQEHAQRAKESAAKDNLRIFRNAIELYAARHDGIAPGYMNSDPSQIAGRVFLEVQMVMPEWGKYLSELPENPFNGISKVEVLQDDEDFPAAPVDTDVYGWIYKPATKTIKLNWPGTDSVGIAYFDY